MIIGSSSVSMASDRTYASKSSTQKVSIMTQDSNPAAILQFSNARDGILEQFVAADGDQKQDDNKQNAALASMNEDAMKKLKDMLESQKTKLSQIQEKREIKTKEQMKMEVLRKLLMSIRKGASKKMQKQIDAKLKELDDLAKKYEEGSQAYGYEGAQGVEGSSFSGISEGPRVVTVWQQVDSVKSSFSEEECTSFQSTGTVKTEDGREINFNVNVEMSRAFQSQYESVTMQQVELTDPLVINVKGNVAQVSDQKFYFDIDVDGEKDQISYLGEGSGFLALDKNKDGKINDGSELFGTKSGDGFKDLAQYDADKNGWIDEADAIFKDLKVWTKTEDGKDELMDLKEAGVGAIYLGNASTQFNLNKADDNTTNAVIKSTGVYLKEDGEVGTVQHVDFSM